MAVEMYLKVDGAEGGVRSRAHKGWAEIHSWHWALARGQANNNGKMVTVTRGNEVVLHKAVGLESTELMRLCATGEIVENAQISTVPAVGKREAAQKYVVLSFERVQVKAMTATAETDDNSIREEVTLRFSKVSFDFYAPSNAESGQQQTDKPSHVFEWDHSARPSS